MSETRCSATMIHGRLLRLAVLTAAVLSLMALMSPPALADSGYSCSQRGNISGDSDIKCFFDNGRRYVTFDTKISGLLTANEAEIIFYLLNENVVKVLNNHSGCTCDVALPLPGCTNAIEDVVGVRPR